MSLSVETGPGVGLLATDGRVILRPKYWAISGFKEGLAYVWDGQSYGFIDHLGKEVIPLFFENAREFSEGVAPVKLNGKWDTSTKGFFRYRAEVRYRNAVQRKGG